MRKLDRIRRKRWYGYDEKLVHELFVKKSTLKANDIPGTLPHVMLLQHNNRDFHRTILWHLRNMDVCACKGLSTMITRCSEPQVRLDHLYLSKNGSASAWLPVISFVCDRVAWRWFSFAINVEYKLYFFLSFCFMSNKTRRSPTYSPIAVPTTTIRPVDRRPTALLPTQQPP